MAGYKRMRAALAALGLNWRLRSVHSASRTVRQDVALLAKTGVVLLISGAMLLWLLVSYLPVLRPEFATGPVAGTVSGAFSSPSASPAPARGEVLRIQGAEFRPRLSAKSFYAGETLVIAGLQGREAVAVKELSVDAAPYSFLKVSSSGFSPGLRLFLFWSTLERPDGVFYAEVPLKADGRGWFNLRREALWQGTLSKIEIGIYGDLRGRPFRLHWIEFAPYSALGVLSTLWTEWTAFTPWQHASINVYRGTAQAPLLWPAAAFTAWLALALSLVGSYVFARRLWRAKLRRSSLIVSPLKTSPLTTGRQGTGPVKTGRLGTAWPALTPPERGELKRLCFGCAFALWGGLILLWMAQLWMQFKESRYQFAGRDYHEKRVNDWDGPYYATAYGVKTALAQQSGGLSVLTTPDVADPLIYRIRFHLLPEWTLARFPALDEPGLKRALFNSRYTLILTGASPAQRQSYLDSARALGQATRDAQGEARDIRILADLPKGVLLEAAPIPASAAAAQKRGRHSYPKRP